MPAPVGPPSSIPKVSVPRLRGLRPSVSTVSEIRAAEQRVAAGPIAFLTGIAPAGGRFSASAISRSADFLFQIGGRGRAQLVPPPEVSRSV
ncbi:hypothetical protein [Nakamurella sp. PAMC28650]|uniref:hypothetical protein n=1 Tax=Nakamurella sp. PAMC28650 TaxID=2762325 RepID=UPI00164D5280|nr:hypothetical protein [Nakamurella sp. PAMC28650]QNK79748.1 hypothetical protein H7F38_15935 [Nakamurella sp. PAMC28650]